MKLSKKHLHSIQYNNTFIGIVLIVVMFLIGLSVNGNFLSANSLSNIFTTASLLAFASLGQTLVVISGGIDLSIASTVSLGAVMSALIMQGSNGNILLALLALILTGVIIGAINAVGILYAKIPPLVMTLAVSNVINVVQMISCNGSPTGSPAPALFTLGKYRVTPAISLITLLLVFVAVFVYFVLKHNGYAKQLYAVGNNRNAAILAGINANRVIMTTYIISAVLAALTGMLLLGYVNFPYINMGAPYGMQTVAAVVIGGAALVGGKGRFSGTIIGAIVLIILSNILVAVQLDDSVKSIINGVVLLVILVFYTRGKGIRQ